MSKLDRPVFDVDLYKGAHSPDSIWKLHRLNDELIRTSYDVMWIEYDENGRFKQKYDVPAVGRSLIMSPFNSFYTWQTTAVTSFQQSVNEDEIVFSTKNSNYILERITNPETNED